MLFCFLSKPEAILMTEMTLHIPGFSEALNVVALIICLILRIVYIQTFCVMIPARVSPVLSSFVGLLWTVSYYPGKSVSPV